MKYSKIAQRLSHILNIRKMTAQELSNRSGVGKSAISHYIHGSHMPQTRNAGMMAEVLKVNPQWLMGWDVPMETRCVPIEDLNESEIQYRNIMFQLKTLNKDGLKRAEEYIADLVEIEKYKKTEE